MTKRQNGFTVIEIIFVIVLLGVSSIIFFTQKNNIEVLANDNVRKSAINSMYYSLEEVFYKANGYYPQTISSENLKSVDPDLFTDPNGILINTSGSEYTYSPSNCSESKCKSYKLTASLAKEDDYIKKSRN